MQEIRSSNPPVVIGICDPNKSRVRHHRNFLYLILKIHIFMQIRNSFEVLANSTKKLKLQKMKFSFEDFLTKFNQIHEFGHIYQVHFKRITLSLCSVLLTFIVICIYESTRHYLWHEELLV